MPDPIRVVVVGPAASTRKVREALESSGITVVDEVRSPDDIRGDEPSDVLVVARTPLERDEPEEDDLAPIEPLTKREQEVLELVSQGLPNKAIASRLRLSDHTVKFHLSSIFGKLGASTRTEAVRRAVRAGLINL